MSTPNDFWHTLANARSPEVWIALVAGTLYVYRKSDNPSRVTRVIEAGISGMLGFSVGLDAAAWAGVNDAIGVALISALGYLCLDVLTSVVADRAAMRDFIIKRLGGK